MSGADELLHQIKHGASQQAGDDVPVAFGHIASYDPKLNRVRLTIPSWRDEGGNAVLTGWMPLTSGWVGNGWGMQIAPKGGASVDNPTQGEPCVISIVRKNQGVHLVAGLYFNQANMPPFPDLMPGEFGMKHETGSLLRFTQDGDVLLTTFRDLVATVGRDALLAVTRDVLVTGARDFKVTASREIDLTAPTVKINGLLALQGNFQISGDILGITGATYSGNLRTSGDVVGRFGVMGQAVSLTGHAHTQPADSHGDTEQPTNAPTGT